MDISLTKVEEAIIQFYENPNGKTDIHHWLTSIQHSTHAWTFAFNLLDPCKSNEVQFFGGNTVYIKVSRYWHELPKEEYEGLKRKLLEMIAKFADNKPIVGRLLKAMAAFVLNTIDNDWPTALEDLVSTFNPDAVTALLPSTALDLLFSLLMIIPDELENCHETMGIPRSKRNLIKSKLHQSSKGVLTLMRQVIEANQVSNLVKEVVIKALDSWLRLPLPLSDTKDLLILLIPYSNYGLLCESVVECLRTALTEYDGKTPHTTMQFIVQLLQLTSVLDEALNAEDENTASLIYGLFTSIVENHSKLLLKVALEDQGEQRAAVLQLVSLLVQCSGTPGQYPTHETLSNIPFSVWYTIQDDLLSFEGNDRVLLMSLFSPVYLQLVDTFLHKSLLPPDEALTAEEKELFRCYRQDICDSYMYTYFILKSAMLEKMERHLEQCIERIQRDSRDWRPLESLLHAYASVAETVAESDTEHVPRFVQCMPLIPFGDNVHLITVALSTLGAYADWLNYHQEFLEFVIPLMIEALDNEHLVGSASQALRDLTLECPVTIAPFAPPILNACQNALVQFPQSDSAVKERIITIIARVLSVGLEQEVIMKHLNQTLTPIISQVDAIKTAAQITGRHSKEQRHQLVHLVKLLSCLARHLNSNTTAFTDPVNHSGDGSSVPPSCAAAGDAVVPGSSEPSQIQHSSVSSNSSTEQPLLMVLRLVLPILLEIIDIELQPDIIEVVCKLLKNSLSTLLSDVEPLIPLLLVMVPKLYCTSLHPAALDVIKLLSVLFGSPCSAHVSQMQGMVEVSLQCSLERLKPDLWRHTDVIKSLLTFATNLVRKQSHMLHPSHVPALYALAIQALNLPEDYTVQAATAYINRFIQISRESKIVHFEAIVVNHMEILLRTVMNCACHPHRQNFPLLCDLLRTLCKFYAGPQMLASFRKIEADDSFLGQRLSRQDKHKFTTGVMGASTVRDTMAAVTDLALASRGVASTEFGSTFPAIPGVPYMDPSALTPPHVGPSPP
ncbi:importin-13 isoform X1 [Hyalella azteca]|uniref:Importin-13 n=1 Tax=Hyalella azteca TaxID=294128 RepID=A0A8B7N370_HYAAZ|nr:importin-13 isoform X2 [Hyalella azteca]XP_018007859.1 importin-13 isoform X1 [Hyalella azteca]